MSHRVLALTRALLPQLLAGSSRDARRLREQAALATIREVDATGTGYYVRFDVPEGAPAADPERFDGGPFGDAVLQSEEEDGRASIQATGFLWLERGRLRTLELAAYDPWPADLPMHIAGVRRVAP